MDNYRITELPLDKRKKTGPPQAPLTGPAEPSPGPAPGPESSLNSKIWDPLVPDNPIPWSQR